MKPVSTDISFPQLEEKILEFWRRENIFQRSMDPEAPISLMESLKGGKRPEYIFYDGPPFATGLPHYGHLLAGTIKDVVGRFFTMKGFHVDRRFGWDCHGLPVEFEIQKEINLHGAKAIREFGIGNFNEECRKIVNRYTKEWRKFVERSGRWVDFEREYRTMDLNFMESIWACMRSLWDRGLVYEGLKCVPYSWAINTPLSNFEANLNYKNTQDPAVTVRAEFTGEFNKAVRERIKLTGIPNYRVVAYVWTTTPWTLPSNMALAVGPDISYVAVLNAAAEEVVILAKSLAPHFFPSLAAELSPKNGHAQNPKETEVVQEAMILQEFSGKELVGLDYQQFFPYFESERAKNAFKIYAADFVSETDGTGIVHLASFGEEDLGVFVKNGISVIDPVDEDGRFTEAVTDFAGQNIKAADSKIIAALKQAGKLVSHKTIEHQYPFCWRTDTPLIYKSISTWFVAVEKIRDELIQINSIISWVPEHLREGRFGKWLEGARDWAISRNRFWGTPIPIWRCEGCKKDVCLGSVQELEELSGAKITDLHRHFIDDLNFPCSACGKTMRRIPEVLDCWFESGAMPYAQAHYPFEGKEQFEKNFPADFIAEGLDQTRGWFYTLLVLSTALFGRPAFKNVVVNGIILAEDGKKMSKSLKNYPPPDEVMNEHGADAMRLYLLASAATRAEDLRFSPAGVREVVRQTLLPLWNAYNFFVTYAVVDGYSPDKAPQTKSENLLDKWILSRTISLVQGVDAALSSYHLYAAAQPILDFVDQLTNWYIRLNRRRFWTGGEAGGEGGEANHEDKLHAYATLHRVLISFVRVLAPLAPFTSEEIFLNLKEGLKDLEWDSVHLGPFPKVEEFVGLEINPALEQAMELFEEVILLGRGVRNDHSLKVRQPLAKIIVVHPEAKVLENLKLLDDYIREELNVKAVEYSTDEEKFVSLKAQLNTKTLGKVLGPKLGSEGMAKLRAEIESLSTAQIRKIESGESLKLQGVELSENDVVVKRSTQPGVKATGSSGEITVVLDTDLTPELRLEGLAREFVNRVQKLRKDFGFEVTDRISVRYMTACPNIQSALAKHGAYIKSEILAVEMAMAKTEAEIVPQGTSHHLPAAQEIEGKAIIIALTRTQG